MRLINTVTANVLSHSPSGFREALTGNPAPTALNDYDFWVEQPPMNGTVGGPDGDFKLDCTVPPPSFGRMPNFLGVNRSILESDVVFSLASANDKYLSSTLQGHRRMLERAVASGQQTNPPTQKRRRAMKKQLSIVQIEKVSISHPVIVVCLDANSTNTTQVKEIQTFAKENNFAFFSLQEDLNSEENKSTLTQIRHKVYKLGMEHQNKKKSEQVNKKLTDSKVAPAKKVSPRTKLSFFDKLSSVFHMTPQRPVAAA